MNRIDAIIIANKNNTTLVCQRTKKKKEISMLTLLKPLIRNANRTPRLYAAITITAPPKYNYNYNYSHIK